MRCACETLFELGGNEANQYVREHLVEVSADVDNWTFSFRCPAVGRSWLLDYPKSHQHGGGSVRLRQLDDEGHPIKESPADPFR